MVGWTMDFSVSSIQYQESRMEGEIMKLGYLTSYSEEEVKFAAEAGFKCLSLGAGPDSSLDAEKITSDEIKKIKEVFAENKLEVSAICSYTYHPDPDKQKYFLRLLDLSRDLGVKVVSTNAFGERSKGIEDNIPGYKKVWSKYARAAEERGLVIAVENCPHAGGYPFTIGNLFYSPQTWKIFFEALPSKAIGLEYDPSHLFWMGVDYIKAIYDFGERIYHVHAKDTEILKEILAVKGILGSGWWRYRIPGRGEIDWKKLFAALLDVGYEGNMVIEHEDPVFEKERHREGLSLGLKYLSQFVY